VIQSSPLGTALEGAEEGQQVTYQAPNGPLTITVLKIEPV
jgi:transcription elongation factor GreA